MNALMSAWLSTSVVTSIALALLLSGAKRQELYVAAGVLASGVLVRYLRSALRKR